MTRKSNVIHAYPFNCIRYSDSVFFSRHNCKVKLIHLFFPACSSSLSGSIISLSFYRTGILQEGDRVLSVNGTLLRNRTYSDVASLLSLKSGVGAGPGGGGSHPLTLMVEFDVADSIVPSSGVFNVKLFKRGAGLGITISCKLAEYFDLLSHFGLIHFGFCFCKL